MTTKRASHRDLDPQWAIGNFEAACLADASTADRAAISTSVVDGADNGFRHRRVDANSRRLVAH